MSTSKKLNVVFIQILILFFTLTVVSYAVGEPMSLFICGQRNNSSRYVAENRKIAVRFACADFFQLLSQKKNNPELLSDQLYFLDIPHDDIDIALLIMYTLYYFYEDAYDFDMAHYQENIERIEESKRLEACKYMQTFMQQELFGKGLSIYILIWIYKFADFFQIPEMMHACAGLLLKRSQNKKIKNVYGKYEDIHSIVNGISGSEDILKSVAWYLLGLKQNLYPASKSFDGHTDKINSAKFSSDGAFIVTASKDKTARVWDVKTCEQIRVLKGHTKRVNVASFSPDGSLTATASNDKTIRLWNVEDGKQLKIFKGHKHWVNSVSFSPDGSQLVSASADESVKIWDVATGKELQEFAGHKTAVKSAGFSLDGTCIISVDSRGIIIIWDANSGKKLRLIHDGINDVTTTTFSPDGSKIASYGDHAIRVWDMKAGTIEHTFEGHTKNVSFAAFSSDGSQIISSSFWDGTIRIWDVATQEVLQVFDRKKYKIGGIHSSPKGFKVIVIYEKSIAIYSWESDNWRSIPEGMSSAYILSLLL